MRDISSPLSGIPSPFGRRAVRPVSEVLRMLERMFPGYLSGARLVCAVPSDPLWHLAAGGEQGSILDCAYPVPGAEPETGYYAILDCEQEIPE
jgi:hypothetical protein